MGTAPITPEVADAIERVAALPDGLQFVRLTRPACVAETLGARLEVVVRLLCELDDPEQGGVLRAAYEAAVARHRREPETPLPPPLPGAPAPHGPAELIAEAERQPGGLELLLEGALEPVAVHFGVHPVVVEAAREQLARHGVRPLGADDAGPGAG